MRSCNPLVVSRVAFLPETATMIRWLVVAVILATAVAVPVDEFADIHPDAKLTAVSLVNKYGYYGEKYQVTTEDGYILEVHRVAGNRKQPRQSGKPVVFLMHGILCDSAGFIVSGPENGLAYILADAGYDVWLGNARGNTYSRKHVSMSALNKEYWSFSWHEIGTRDLPAMIDFVLAETKQQQLFFIGHSQGTSAFFVMASERPAYQDKVKAMFGMAPVAYCGRMANPFAQVLARFTGKLHLLAKLIGMHEFEPTTDFIRDLAATVCHEDEITQPICSNILFLICGFSREQLNTTLLPVVLGHAPAGASVKQFAHYGQLIQSRKFRQYDYGAVENLKRYRKLRPPSYDLKHVKVPVYLHYSTNDWLAHVRDVHQLYGELGNPVAKFRVPHDTFNHIDFLWGKDAKRFVYNKILGLLAQYD